MDDPPRKERRCKQQTLDSFVVNEKDVGLRQDEEDPLESDRPNLGCAGRPLIEGNIYEGGSIAMAANDGVSRVLLYNEAAVEPHLSGLSLSPFQPDVMFDESEADSGNAIKTDDIESLLQNLQVSTKMACSFCQCTFENRTQQTEHYKLDWHRYNLKQSILGARGVSEEDFENMTGDISSISGSDYSDNDDDNKNLHNKRKKQLPSCKAEPRETERKSRGHPRIFYRNSQNQLISIYRCLLQGKKEGTLRESDLIQRLYDLPNSLKVAVLMTAGGHFASAIFHGAEVVLHKTFHRYTVRAKGGTAQCVRDSQGNAPKSLGASLRRYNEAQLYENISDLLNTWASHLKLCQLIFIRAPSYNRQLFFGGKHPPLSKKDPRIRTIPFPTRRPTFREVQRVWEILATLENHGDAEKAEKKYLKSFVDDSIKEEAPLIAALNQGHQEERTLTSGSNEIKEDKGLGSTDATLENVNPELSYAEKAKLNHQSSPAEEAVDSEDDVISGDGDFALEEVVTLTSDLKESEVFPKKRRKKKRKTPAKEDFLPKDKTLRKIHKAILSSCKAGDKDGLEKALQLLRQKLYADAQNEQSESKCDDIDDISKADACSTNSDQNNIDSNDISKESAFVKDDQDGGGRCVDAKPSSKPGDPASKGNVDFLNSVQRDISVKIIPFQDQAQEQNVKISQGSTNDQFRTYSSNQHSQHSENLKPDLSLNQNQICQAEHNPIQITDDIVNCKFNSFLNLKFDEDHNTFLHVAAFSGRWNLLWSLMGNGADPAIKNKKRLPAYMCSADKQTRNEFRQFMSAFPHRYDYKTAQIPAPLTEEQEAERTAKAAEKKKTQRKARKIKQKEEKEEERRQHEEEEKRQKEEEERKWFAALSDREKRAVAAERRLKQQFQERNSSVKCWQCGADMTGKVPFHYYEYEMCSVQCLKVHRQKTQ